MIEIHFVEMEVLDLSSEFFSLWLYDVVNREGFDLGNINLIFTSDDYLLDVNRKYLNHDYYTDIITFDYSENNVISGDLFISIDRVRDNSKKLNQMFHVELNRVVVHGVLHLCGYGDKSDDEKLLMRKKEDFGIILLFHVKHEFC